MGDDLSAAYREHDFSVKSRLFKRGCIVGLVFMLSGIAIDYMVYPQYLWQFFQLRVFADIAICTLLILHYVKYKAQHIVWITLLFGTICSFSISFMMFLSEGPRSPYYGGLNLVLVCIAVLVPLASKEIALLGFITLAMHFFFSFLYFYHHDLPINYVDLSSSTFFIVLTAVACTVICFFASRARFQDFYLRYQVDQKNKELDAKNAQLDGKNKELDAKNAQLDTKNQELEELDKLKSQFFANVSHELRTPLTLIISPIQDLLKKTKQLPEVAQDALLIAVRNAMRLLKLINELLETLKLDEGRLVLNRVQFEFSNYLKGLVESIEHLARAKKLTITLEGAEEVISMYGDKDRLEKVFLNLLMNAIKYTPRGGRVIVRWYVGERVRGEGSAFAGATVGQGRGEKNEGQEEVKDTEDFGLRTSDLVIVEIEDTGVGIPAEQLPHIFDRFYQVDGGATRKAQGVGIGLSLVKGLVEKHGGRIEVESEEGKGSVFRVELPIYQKLEVRSEELEEEGLDMRDQGFVSAEGEGEELGTGGLGLWGDEREKELRPIYQAADRFMVASSDRAEDLKEAGKGDYTILIVDDEPDMRRYILWALEEDYHLLQAKEGRAALDLARRKKPDLILLDWMIPEISGIDVCKQLRAHEETKDIKIIILTAKIDEVSKIQALECGANDFLTKPFSTIEVKARIDAQLRELELHQRNLDLEETLQKVMEAETQLIKMGELGTLASGFLHEIRQPINSIYAALQLLQKEIPQENGEACERVDDLQEGIEQIHTMVADLWTYAYPDREGKKEHFSLYQTVASVLRLTASKWRGIALHNHIAQDVEIYGSKTQVTHLLTSLLVNACRALRQIEPLRSPSIHISGRVQGERFFVRLRDNGAGISPKIIGQIFDPFFTTQKEGEGLGIGLSICRTIVKNHGGELNVESEEGVYTEFCFDVPLFREEPRQSERSVKRDVRGK